MFNLELLESRTNPSITFSDGVVVATGTDSPDSVYSYHPGGNQNLVTFVHVGGGEYHALTVPTSAVQSVVVNLGNGDDLYFAGHVSPITEFIDGGNGNDFLLCGRGAGVVTGGAGNDWLMSGNHFGLQKIMDGNAGNDLYFCGIGSDVVNVEAGADQVFGFDPSEDFEGVIMTAPTYQLTSGETFSIGPDKALI